MKRIVITLPHFFEGEAASITAMLESGAERVHIRKPGATETDIAALVESIAPQYRSRLSLHDAFGLAVPLGVGGVHLNSRNSEPPAAFTGLVSRSCHSLEELRQDADYLFLSPIFDSISKSGYRSAFTTTELTEASASGLIGPRVYALGGVFPGNFMRVESLGFGGAALLGAAWQPVDSARFRLQYITQGETDAAIISGVREALAGGCRWVQLRMKDATAEHILAVAPQVADMCHIYGATFLLDDHVELVEATGAHGVHVGKNDMPVAEVRRILGPGYIVGATANTADDIIAAAAAGADYCGLGPLRFTTTKKKLSPTLGYEGVAAVMGRCREAGVHIPVVAIGGIVPVDIEPLARAVVQGIAVSGAIAAAETPREAARIFMKHINTYISCKN